MTKSFDGQFCAYLQMFLDEKHALGLEYREGERILHKLDDMSKVFNCNEGLSKELVLAFTEKQPHWRKTTQEGRVNFIKQFATFLANKGIKAYIPDSHSVTKSDESFAPYIFTKNEIAAIFEKVDRIQTRNGKMKHLVLPVLFRMLYGCGLRISEALALKVSDVDLENGVLKILDSKNHKDRLLPMSESLRLRCLEYADTAHRFSNDNDYFFYHDNGIPYKHSTIYHYFRNILWECGISHGGRSYGPRLHDVRHTFSVHSLQQFDENGVDLMAAMPLLSAYLGHSNLSATGKYLRLTAECFPSIGKKVEAAYGYMIPEGGGFDETN